MVLSERGAVNSRKALLSDLPGKDPGGTRGNGKEGKVTVGTVVGGHTGLGGRWVPEAGSRGRPPLYTCSLPCVLLGWVKGSHWAGGEGS